MMTFAGKTGEFGQRVESEVHLAGGAAILVALYLVAEIFAQVLGLDELQEREVGIDAGRNNVGIVFVA